jgi:release factor glutamine methyltransferase
MPSLSQLLSAATEKIKSSDSARLDAEILLALVLGKQRSYLYSHPEQSIDKTALARFISLIEKRQQGFPIAYLTGQKEFWSLPLTVNDTTLIPRPETELVVAQALKRIPENASLSIADLGTGSGAITMAIASERPNCHFVASDREHVSLLLAKLNAEQLRLKNTDFICADWSHAFKANCLDIIVSNPPYIAENDPHLSSGDVRFEPRHALIAGSDGLDDIKQIIKQSTTILKPDGWLILEHGYGQQEAVKQLFQENEYTDVETFHDLAGNPRVSLGKIKKSQTYS